MKALNVPSIHKVGKDFAPDCDEIPDCYYCIYGVFAKDYECMNYYTTEKECKFYINARIQKMKEKGYMINDEKHTK